MKIAGKVVWITGASSGMGEAVALEMAGKANTLIVSAPTEDMLKEVCAEIENRGSKCVKSAFDLGSTEAIEDAFKKVKQQVDRIDILINNGGISQRSLAEKTPLEIDRKVFEINYFGTVALTKLVMQEMIERKSGHLVALSSIAGKFGFPLRSAYSSTKHAIKGFFETLTAELHKYNIKVTLIYPGRVQTQMSLHALTEDGSAHGKMDPGQAKGLPSDKAAKRIVSAIEKNKRSALVGKSELAMVYIYKYLRPLYYKMARSLSAH